MSTLSLVLFLSFFFFVFAPYFSSVLHQDCSISILVWSLNAKFEPNRYKADKSAKFCMQFPWDMSMKSEMSAQEKKTFCYRIKWEILFIIVLLCLVTTLILKIVFATVLKDKMAQNLCKDFPE